MVQEELYFRQNDSLVSCVVDKKPVEAIARLLESRINRIAIHFFNFIFRRTRELVESYVSVIAYEIEALHYNVCQCFIAVCRSLRNRTQHSAPFFCIEGCTKTLAINFGLNEIAEDFLQSSNNFLGTN